MELGCSNGSYKHMHRSSSATGAVTLDNNNTNDSCKGASFIKLLGPDFSNQLQIPREFTKTFNGYKPHRFIIENATTKKCWRVEAEQEGDGTMYFRKGWSDFVEAHSLQVGYFLLFEYEEPPIFQARIYDTHGCQKLFEDAGCGTPNPLKISDFEALEKNEDLEFGRKELGTIHSDHQKTRKLSTMKYGNWTSIKKKNAKPTRTATVSMVGNNIVFSVKLHKYKTHQFSALTVPKAISSAKNLVSKDEIMLENVKGDRWVVRLSHRRDGRSILSHGWKAFLEDNGVAAGNTLKFEFVSDGLVKVRVAKDSQLEQKSEETMSQVEDNVAEEMDSEDDELDDGNVEPPETPISTKRGRKRGSSELSGSSFSFIWRPTTSGFYLHVPKVVTESHNLLTGDKVALRDQEGKCWPLEVSRRRDGRMALTKGWVEFWKGHDIKAGDTMHFDFVSDYLIQVDITRGTKPLGRPNNAEQDVVNLSIADDDEPATQPDRNSHDSR